MKKRRYILGIIFLISLAILVVFACITESILKEILIVLISFGGAIAAFMQISKSSSLSTGEFILNLQQTYASNDDFVNLFLNGWNDFCKMGKEKSLLEIDKAVLVNYLTFFESIYVMLDRNVLSIELLDDLFARRFFIVVNNRTIQAQELLAGDTYKYYINIYKLYYIWKKYRVEREKKQRRKNPKYFDEIIHVTNENYIDLLDALEQYIGEDKIKDIIK